MISITMHQRSNTLLTIIQTIYSAYTHTGSKIGWLQGPPFLERCPIYVAPSLIDIPTMGCC